MIFMGIDHGTSAVRFAVLADGSTDELVRFFEIPREAAGSLSPEELQKFIEEHLGMTLYDIDLTCLTYSMGDGISQIEEVFSVQNRGVVNTSGVGEKTNAGTNVYDIFAHSLFTPHIYPAVLLPGLHQNNPVTDSRMQHFSHQASPEKIGAAYHAYSLGYHSFILSDIGSNTVTLAVSDGKILGALDAPVFAPGTRHGPLDVNAIRDVDAGVKTANDAFSNAGVGDDKMKLAFFAAMEISALDVLMKDYRSAGYTILAAGSGGEDKEVRREISRLLQKPVEPLGKWAAAFGCAGIAQALVRFEADSIFGIPVNFDRERWNILRG